MKKLIVFIISFTTIILTGCKNNTTSETILEQTGSIQTGNQNQINSFEDCIQFGFPIMESYPRQCSDGINTFKEIIEQTGSIQTGNIDIPEIIDIQGQNTGDKPSETTTTSGTKSTNLNILQQRLKASVEKRNQTTSGVATTPDTIQTIEKPKVSSGITENDINELENIINKIIE